MFWMRVKIKIQKIFSRFRLGWKKFGKHSVIYQPILVSGKKGISIGNNVFIRNGARFECIFSWGGASKQHYDASITIGDNTSIEQNVQLCSAGKLQIGHDCLLTADVYVGNVIHSYESPDQGPLGQPLIVEDVSIGDYTFIGVGTKVLPGSHIGKNCIIGANSVIKGEIPDYSVAAGCPARVIKRYDFESGCWRKTDGASAK